MYLQNYCFAFAMEWRDSIKVLFGKPADRWKRFLRDVFVDLLLINVALVGAYLLAYDLNTSILTSEAFRGHFIPITILGVGLLSWRGLYRINPRYMGLWDVGNVVLVGLLEGLGFCLFRRVFQHASSSNDLILIPVLFAMFSAALLVGWRVAMRVLDWSTPSGKIRRGAARRTLIVGAGDAGELISREMHRSKHSDHVAIGFVDDNPQKHGLLIHGVKVLGSCADIPKLSEEFNIDEVVVAIPSADGAKMRRIMAICDQAGLKMRTLPPVAEILGQERIGMALREVQIEDLLRREPAKFDLAQMSGYLSAETVLITGGGGSIGSELARQIAKLNPANLILLGKGENSIYEIEQELINLGFTPISIVGDIRDKSAMESVFSTLRPTVVFHAAAHKHVPLMQGNVLEAVKNNVMGTQNLLELASRYGVRKFVYISTDKAVNPSNVMGATKRVGEMLVRAMAQRSETEFAIVRFGNVLGSRGSLIPILRKQIKRGGPVRITHPDMTRYFMTIPEAVTLILQAGSMGTNGELFILDMGEPVKIVDLARDLIRLHGLVPGEDIDIVFTGMRPGEKTHEELVYPQEELVPTPHEKIRSVNAQPINEEWLKSEFENLCRLTQDRNIDGVRQHLMELAWGKSNVPYRFAVVEPIQDSADIDN